MLPRPANDGPVKTHHSLVGEFFATLGSFFQKPGVVLAMAFILLYRFDEAQLVKVISPFLLDSRDAGGLGLTTSQVGLVYGTFGILALTCGGLLGGFTAAKYGLKRMLPIMVARMYLPKLAFVFPVLDPARQLPHHLRRRGRSSNSATASASPPSCSTCSSSPTARTRPPTTPSAPASWRWA